MQELSRGATRTGLRHSNESCYLVTGLGRGLASYVQLRVYVPCIQCVASAFVTKF